MTNEQLAILIKQGINTADNMLQLYKQVKAFIHVTARKYEGYAEIEDLEQEGYLALHDAVEGYCPEFGCKFLTYAGKWIKQRMQRYIHDNGTCIRIPVHKWEKIQQYKKAVNAYHIRFSRRPEKQEIAMIIGVSYQEVLDLEKVMDMAKIGSIDSTLPDNKETTIGDMVQGSDDVEGFILGRIEQEQLKEVIWPIVDSLSEQQAKVIRCRYQENKTLKETGKEIGVTLERVRTIESDSLRELRKPSRRNRLRAFLPEAAGSGAYTGCGIQQFNNTWTSSTERMALYLTEDFTLRFSPY